MSEPVSEAHLSIGEVLGELRDDHPDITISKIRFLESQGLIAPERTPSGYRKFYPDDVARLRWILHQQKDNFLPLKVIRERLEASPGTVPPADDGEVAVAVEEPDPSAAPTRSTRSRPGTRRADPPRVEAPMLPLDDGSDDEPLARRGPATGAHLTREELVKASGLDDHQVAELESYGLLVAITHGDRVHYDEEALAVARTAAAFARHGVEARHLKMYQHAADREATMFGQIVLPVLRQRNPESRARAQEELEELARLGRVMRAAMLRRSVQRALGG